MPGCTICRCRRSAEIVLEGYIHPGETALEGPFGDHTGYYNEQERFPVFTVERITMRARSDLPLDLHRQAAGRAGGARRRAERSVRAAAARSSFRRSSISICRRKAARTASPCVSMKKQYPGHAKRVMFGVWSFLRQFMYTKFIIVTDDDVNVRDWKEVIWALTTRVDPRRDTLIADATPIDYLDFASPVAGPRLEDGHRRDQQVAGRKPTAQLGHADRDERRGEGARGCAVERARVVHRSSATLERRTSSFRPDRYAAYGSNRRRPTAAARPAPPARCPRSRGSR